MRLSIRVQSKGQELFFAVLCSCLFVQTREDAPWNKLLVLDSPPKPQNLAAPVALTQMPKYPPEPGPHLVELKL